MTPSGDMPDEQAQEQTFSLANMVPQTAQLNRGIWEGVESVVRHLAEREGEIYVVTGPAFHGDSLSSIGPNGVLVPTSTWKAVFNPRAGSAGVYVCKNTDRPTCDTVSVATLTRVVGIDPFPGSPERLKRAGSAGRPAGGGGSHSCAEERGQPLQLSRGAVDMAFAATPETHRCATSTSTT